LAQKDIRFARTVQRLQRAVLAELEKVGIIHLYTLGFRGDDLISFNLRLNNPSKIAELQELEQWSTKFDVASAATEGFFSKRWIAEKLFGLSEEDFLRNQREMFTDRKMQAQWDAAAEMGAEEGAGGGGGALGGEDLGGEMDMGAEEDLGGEDLGGEDLGGEEPVPEEEGPLLAEPPAKRDDKVHEYEKGSYKAKEGVGDRRKGGARKRHNKRKSGPEVNTRRKNFPGVTDLFSLVYGVTEEVDNNYRQEEEKVFEVNNASHEVKLLIEQLEKKENEKNAQE